MGVTKIDPKSATETDDATGISPTAKSYEWMSWFGTKESGDLEEKINRYLGDNCPMFPESSTLVTLVRIWIQVRAVALWNCCRMSLTSYRD